MSSLTDTRTSNATKIGQTDDWEIELEADIAGIFGIEVGRNIAEPIFRSASTNVAATADIGNAGQVNSDGSITGVMRVVSLSSAADLASGFEFQSSNGTRFKITPIGDNLELYQWNDDDEVWELLSTINTLSDAGTWLALADVDEPGDYVGKDGYIPYVVEDEEADLGGYFRLTKPSGIGGYPEWIDDVDPPDATDDGKVLTVNVGLGDEITMDWEPVSGTGGVNKLADLSDCDGFSDPMTEQGASLLVCNPAGSSDLKARAFFSVGGKTGHKYSTTSTSTAISSESISLKWYRVTGANPTDWGDNEEGGDMSSFIFSDAGSGDGDYRYIRINLPGRFPGFYEIIVTLKCKMPSSRSIDLVMTEIPPSAPAGVLYILNNHINIPMNVNIATSPNPPYVVYEATAGVYQARFQVLVTQQSVVTPSVAISACLIGTLGVAVTNIDESESSIMVIRRG